MVLKHIILINPNAIIWFAGDLNLPKLILISNLTASTFLDTFRAWPLTDCYFSNKAAKHS